ncbi:MAG: oligopeptide/dipeptide ABC transporter ATP-binding protein [Acetobacteraceae bacterium]
MSAPALELRGVSKTFRTRGAAPLRAVIDVTLEIAAGECLALVGESGSGKSTLARIALRLIEPDAGDVMLGGQSLMRLGRDALRRARRHMQPIFQDPAASFNPRRNIRSTLQQTVAAGGGRHAGDEELSELLAAVRLKPAADYLERYPHELSGGQRQRLAVARALAPRPDVIIADEPLSGADVSIRAEILNLLVDLQMQRGVAYLLITHDMLVARAFSRQIAVMYRGRIVEQGSTDEVLARPLHPYTQRLLAVVPSLDAPPRAYASEALDVSASAGCAYRPRCPLAGALCCQIAPTLRKHGTNHSAACHYAENAGAGDPQDLLQPCLARE